MRKLKESLLSITKKKVKLRCVTPVSKYLTSETFNCYNEAPEIKLHSLILREHCSAFSSPGYDDLVLVFNKANDTLQFVEAKEIEQNSFVSEASLIHTQTLDIPQSQHDSIKLNTSILGSDACFLENNKMLVFITPEGLVQQWDANTRKFQILHTAPLKDPICPTLDGRKRKLYYFTGDASLYSLDLTGDRTPEYIDKLDCQKVLNATLISGLEDILLIQADQNLIIWFNVETGRSQKFSNDDRFYKSAVNSSLVKQTDKTISIVNFQTGFSESRVMLKSPELLRQKPVAFSQNASGPFHAIGFEDGSICLVREGSWSEECIIAQSDQYLELGQCFVELEFSQSGQHLLARDSRNNLHRFVIRQNLKLINRQNLQKVKKDTLFGLFKAGKHNFEEEFKRDERSSSVNQSIKDLRRNYNQWRSGIRDIYNIEEEATQKHPITITKIPGRSALISLDSDNSIRIWNIFGEQCTRQIKSHLSQFKQLTSVTLFYWDYIRCFVVVFEEVLLFLEQGSFKVVAHLQLNNSELIKQTQCFGTYLYISTDAGQQYAFEFVGEQLHIRASRQFPCIFNLYEPQDARIVMYPGIEGKVVPFFPKVFLNHAFEQFYDSFSPILFWYKVTNYNGLKCSTLESFQGHEHILFHYNRFSLLHLYAFHNKDDLLKAALQHNAPLLIDAENESPLSVAIERKSIPCVKALLTYLSKEHENPLYDNVSIIQLSKHVIPSLPFKEAGHAFLSLDVDPQCKYNLPNFANMKGNHEKVIPLNDELPNEVLDKHVEVKQDKNLMVYSLSRMEFDVTFGSRESIKFFDSMLESPHIEIFDSPAIQSYVRYKWKQAKIWFIIECCLFLTYLTFLSIHATRNRDATWNVIVVLIFSCLQACQEIWQMVGQKRQYLRKLWNILDLTGVISVWTYVGQYFAHSNERVRLVFLTYSTALIWWKSFSYTRFKQANRFFIRNVGQTFSNIKPFLSFMVIYTLAFAVIFVATQPQRELNDRDHAFGTQIFYMYQFALGKYDPSGTVLRDIIYIPATILVTVTLFNLLIAIVRDAYLKVKENRIANDYSEIVNIINDYQTMAMWNLNKASYRYLFVAQDAFQTKGTNDLELVRSPHKGNALKQTSMPSASGGDKTEALTNAVEKLVKRMEEMNNRLNRVEMKLVQRTEEVLKVQADQSYELKKMFQKSQNETDETPFQRKPRRSYY